jgi:hypothetical protein
MNKVSMRAVTRGETNPNIHNHSQYFELIMYLIRTVVHVVQASVNLLLSHSWLSANYSFAGRKHLAARWNGVSWKTDTICSMRPPAGAHFVTFMARGGIVNFLIYNLLLFVVNWKWKSVGLSRYVHT